MIPPVADPRFAWFVGLFEGEGSVFAFESSPGRYSLRLSIGMTDLDVLERARDATGKGSISGPYRRSPSNLAAPCSPKPLWQWTVGKADDCLELIEAMMPLLGGRRRSQATGALRTFWSAPAIRPPAEARFWRKVEVDSESGCWRWTATKEKGRGYFWPGGPFGRRRVAASRFAWELMTSAPPPRLLFNVGCNAGLGCVNPSHYSVKRSEAA